MLHLFPLPRFHIIDSLILIPIYLDLSVKEGIYELGIDILFIVTVVLLVLK